MGIAQETAWRSVRPSYLCVWLCLSVCSSTTYSLILSPSRRFHSRSPAACKRSVLAMSLQDRSIGGPMRYAGYEDDDESHILGYGMGDAYVPSKLQNITFLRVKDVDHAKKSVTADVLTDLIAKFDNKYGPPLNLFERIRAEAPSMALAAEFKRASPSKGDIAPSLDPVEQCNMYASVGAAVLSVLTETTHFKGSLDDMRAVRLAIQKSFGALRPAILRKDFIFDSYQVLEARANGCDTVLLIVAILGKKLLNDLIIFCRLWDVEPLVEVHTEAEMELALDAGARVIGVNNRDLHTFQLDMYTTDKCAAVAAARGIQWGISGEVVLCALSGISSRADVERYQDIGVQCCLIGETLMKAADPRMSIQSLLGTAKSSSTIYSTAGDIDTKFDIPSAPKAPLIVKVCGLRDPEQAAKAVSLGANLVGVIFAQGSKRRIDESTAKAVVEKVRQYGERTDAVKLTAPAPTSTSQGIHSPEEWFGHYRDLIATLTTTTPMVVGVFQNQDVDYINSVVAATGLDMVQLHGDESEFDVDEIIVPVIKVMHVPVDEDIRYDQIRQNVYKFANKAAMLLLDSSVKGTQGGTGQSFDWLVARRLHDENIPVILAGGLDPTNVAIAVQDAIPCGVDASSGLEDGDSKPRKQLNKVRDYIMNAREGFKQQAVRADE